MTWLDRLGLTNAQVAQVLAVSRLAEDDASVQRAFIRSVSDGVAIVQRWDWHGRRLSDYPVTVSK